MLKPMHHVEIGLGADLVQGQQRLVLGSERHATRWQWRYRDRAPTKSRARLSFSRHRARTRGRFAVDKGKPVAPEPLIGTHDKPAGISRVVVQAELDAEIGGVVQRRIRHQGAAGVIRTPGIRASVTHPRWTSRATSRIWVIDPRCASLLAIADRAWGVARPIKPKMPAIRLLNRALLRASACQHLGQSSPVQSNWYASG